MCGSPPSFQEFMISGVSFSAIVHRSCADGPDDNVAAARAPFGGRTMDNETLEAVTSAVLVVFLAVFVSALRGSRAPLLALNVIAAITIIVYDVNPLRYILEDWRLQAIVACEILAVIAALAAFRNVRPAVIFSYAVFGVHLCVAAASVYLAFFFRITRLI